MGWGPKPYLPFIYFQLFQLPSPPSLTGVPIWPLHSTILVQGHVKALWKTFFSAKIENVDKFKSICGQKLMLTKYNFEELVIQFHFVREKPNIWQLCVFFISLPHTSFQKSAGKPWLGIPVPQQRPPGPPPKIRYPATFESWGRFLHLALGFLQDLRNIPKKMSIYELYIYIYYPKTWNNIPSKSCRSSFQNMSQYFFPWRISCACHRDPIR